MLSHRVRRVDNKVVNSCSHLGALARDLNGFIMNQEKKDMDLYMILQHMISS